MDQVGSNQYCWLEEGLKCKIDALWRQYHGVLAKGHAAAAPPALLLYVRRRSISASDALLRLQHARLRANDAESGAQLEAEIEPVVEAWRHYYALQEQGEPAEKPDDFAYYSVRRLEATQHRIAYEEHRISSCD